MPLLAAQSATLRGLPFTSRSTNADGDGKGERRRSNDLARLREPSGGLAVI